MRRPSCLGTVILILALLAIGRIFFPVPSPHLELAANYSAPFFKIGPFPITNSIITGWLSMLVLILVCVLGTRKMKLVPRGLQNFVEWALEKLLSFVEGVAGSKNARRFFPVIATIFLFVITNAWMGLLPGYTTISFRHVPLLRPANTDINFPLALALVSFVFVEFMGLRSLGFFHYGSKFIRLGQLRRGLVSLFKGRVKEAFGGLFFGVVDMAVGALEALSEFIRIISFTFRLFGNMTAGETLLLVVAFLIPWVVGTLFFGLEGLLGFIQALIFSGLTLVFATVAVTPHGEEH